MTSDELVRVLVGMLGSIFIMGSLGEMWYGPRRGMTWAQFFRYSAVVVIVGGVVVYQYNHRNISITNYTIAVAIGVALGSAGVLPALKTPMRKKKTP